MNVQAEALMGERRPSGVWVEGEIITGRDVKEGDLIVLSTVVYAVTNVEPFVRHARRVNLVGPEGTIIRYTLANEADAFRVGRYRPEDIKRRRG